MEQPEIIEQGLLDIKTYNLMMRLIEEKRSLSRIRIRINNNQARNNYEESRNFLRMKKNKEEHIKELEERLGKTSILNLEMNPQKNLRALLTNQGSPEKGIDELSKWYNLPIK